MADLCDACSNWLTVGLQFGRMSPTKVADVFKSATDVGDCEQAVMTSEQSGAVEKERRTSESFQLDAGLL